jgi:hypothetical protein
MVRRLVADVQRDSLADVFGTLGFGLLIFCSWPCGDSAAFALHSPFHWHRIGGLDTTTQRLYTEVTCLNHSGSRFGISSDASASYYYQNHIVAIDRDSWTYILRL